MRRLPAIPANISSIVKKSKLPPAEPPPPELPELLLDDDELLELLEEELLELEDDELLELDEEELLELELEELEEDELLELEELPPPNTVARLDVALIPLVPLISILPQVVRLFALKLLVISNAVQQLPLPDQDQPMYPTSNSSETRMMEAASTKLPW